MEEDIARKNLRSLLAKHKVGMAPLSRACGKDPSYIYKYFTGSPRLLPDDAVQVLARYFKVPADMFRVPHKLKYHQLQKLGGLSDAGYTDKPSRASILPEIEETSESGYLPASPTQELANFLAHFNRLTPDNKQRAFEAIGGELAHARSDKQAGKKDKR